MNELVVELRTALRLDDWYVGLEESDDPAVLTGWVKFDRENRRATIIYNPETVTSHTIRHEMVHILLHDMSFLASNGRSVEMMEAINMYEERICNVLAEVLTG